MAKVAKEKLTHNVEIKGVSKKIHIDADGKESRSAVAGETEFRMLFAGGDMIVVRRSDFSNEVWDAAGWHGVAQKLGDSYAGQKESGDDPFENASAMVEQLRAGTWVTESKATGPRIGLLVEAIMAVKANAGLEADQAEIAERCKDKEYVKGAKARDDVNAEYQRIVAKRAAERAAKAIGKAQETESAEGVENL